MRTSTSSTADSTTYISCPNKDLGKKKNDGKFPSFSVFIFLILFQILI